MKKLIAAFFILFIYTSATAQYQTRAQQLVTNEDSLNMSSSNNKTVVSGYGSAFYQRDFNAKQSTATLERAVLFVGHRFNEKISLFTELEVENAKVEGGDEGGEVAMEQAYVRFNLNARQYLVAGLFVPRIGILNENHLPVNFNGVERPIVETYIIPATWRELGIGFYGSANNAPLNYSVALMNGLNSANFEHNSGIREGRAEGKDAFANNLAVTASLQYFVNDFKFQISGYAGGTVGLNPDNADSLGVKGGAFGTPLYLGEADMQYSKNGFAAKALASYILYPDVEKINIAYDNNIAKGLYGAYAELGYDWLYKKQKKAQFITFARCELLDLNSSVAPKGIYDGTLKQTHIIAGFSYLPIPNVVIKTDVRFLHTGNANPQLPEPDPFTYQSSNQFLNIGIGYSF
jgi:hypothetical protein